MRGRRLAAAACTLAGLALAQIRPDPPAGWQRIEPAAAMQLVRGGPPPSAWAKPAAGPLALFVACEVPASHLGSAGAERFPGPCLEALRTQLAAIAPPPRIVSAGPVPGQRAAELVAEGGFPDLGAPRGRAIFRAAVGRDGRTWLLAGFAADAATEAELRGMMARF